MRRPRSDRVAPPRLTDPVISRRRLFARLGTHPTVVVVGAAGYGKSLLLASWLEETPPPGTVAWLTLDPSDEDPGRLAADLLAALRSPCIGSPAAAIAGLEDPPAFADHLSFVDAIHEALSDAETALTLVLDDVHHISGSARALAMVDRFIAWAPPSTRVILASRSMPHLRLQRLRLENRLELIELADLAFTRDETAAAVGAWGLGLGPDAIVELDALTQGWPAATRLAVLAVRSGGRRDLALSGDDPLAEYLTTEVLDGLDADLRAFVVDAAVDEVVCPSLLDAVRGRSDSGRLLERCVNEGLLITRESGGGADPWFRWHGLLTAHVQGRRAAEPDTYRDAERRAALWWRLVDPAVAVRHALAAQEDALAGEIAASAWLDLVLSGRAESARSMANAVPEDVPSAAELHLAKAFVAAEQSAIDEARAELGAARAVSERLTVAQRAQFEMRATVIELFVVRDRAALTESLVRGHELLTEAESARTPVDRGTMALTKLHVGMSEARLLDHPLEAVRLLREAQALAGASGYTALEVMARAEALIPSIARGHLDEARSAAEAVLAETNAKGWGGLPGTAMAYGYLGWLALWQGDPHRAVALLDRCEATLLPNDWGMLGLVATVRAQASLSDGDVDGAARASARGRELARHGRMPPWWPSLQRSLDAMVLTQLGRPAEAQALVAVPPEGPEFHLATCFRACVHLRADDAVATLETLDTVPPDRLFPHVSCVVDVVRAQALVLAGDRLAAHVALERALLTSSHFGLLEPFRLVGTMLVPLLTEHLRTGTQHEAVVRRVIGHLTTAAPVLNDWGDALTRRELTILRYLATDMSVAEIAAAEFVSANTVKTHVSHLYRKLEVANRRSAVRAAARLGLL